MDGPLIEPSNGEVGLSGDSHLNFAGISQINDVLGHAVLFSPRGIPAGALVVVAKFWFENTEIAFGQRIEAAVAVAVAVTFWGFIAAIDTNNGTFKSECDLVANFVVEGDEFLFEDKVVVSRIPLEMALHFAQGSSVHGNHRLLEKGEKGKGGIAKKPCDKKEMGAWRCFWLPCCLIIKCYRGTMSHDAIRLQM